MKVYCVKAKKAVVYATEAGVLDIANKHILFGATSSSFFGLVQTLDQAIKLLERDGFEVEEKNNAYWFDTYVMFSPLSNPQMWVWVSTKGDL